MLNGEFQKPDKYDFLSQNHVWMGNPGFWGCKLNDQALVCTAVLAEDTEPRHQPALAKQRESLWVYYSD